MRCDAIREKIGTALVASHGTDNRFDLYQLALGYFEVLGQSARQPGTIFKRSVIEPSFRTWRICSKKSRVKFCFSSFSCSLRACSSE